jgi:hypothetical protein
MNEHSNNPDGETDQPARQGGEPASQRDDSLAAEADSAKAMDSDVPHPDEDGTENA